MSKKIITVITIILTLLYLQAYAGNWGSEVLSENHRPEQDWIDLFSKIPDIIAENSISDAIEACDNIVGEHQHCVIELSNTVNGFPVKIERSRTKLVGTAGMNPLTSAQNDSFIYIGDNTEQLIIEQLNLQGHEAGDNEIHGIFIEGQNISRILIRNNKIHNFYSDNNAHGIAVYGTGSDDNSSIHDIIIDANQITSMRTGSSESIAINGNVKNWQIINNSISDINNIAIAAIGGEGVSPVKIQQTGRVVPGDFDAARYGFIEYNHVKNMSTLNNPAYGNENTWAGAIYIDGAHDIKITDNSVVNTPWAYDIGAENCVTARNIHMSGNYALLSYFGDLLLGGYAATGYLSDQNINCDPANTQDENEGHGSVSHISINNNQFSSNNTLLDPVNIQYRTTHAVVSETGVAAVGSADGSASGDDNAIRITANEYTLSISNQLPNGDLTEHAFIREEGEKRLISVKPRAGYIGHISIDGVPVANSSVAQLLRYRLIVTSDHQISTYYTNNISQPAEGFSVISNEDWNETAVRKVLHIFAYGGHADDAQITLWADMEPSAAIKEMLTFTPVNLKLSPDSSAVLGQKTDGTLRSLAAFWSSDDTDNIIPEPLRDQYRIDNFYIADCYEQTNYWHGDNFIYTWIHSVLAKGSNPFMHKIGFWETNYHMVANTEVGDVNFWNQMNHYDNIISALMQNNAYQDVLAVGALDLAIALQYGHVNQYWIDGSGGQNGNYINDNNFFSGNEDFAREYHQLFFGILGDNDHDYHENVTIKNTARAFTDIRRYQIDISSLCDFNEVRGFPDNKAVFAESFHHTDSLEMYHEQFSGANAEEKIKALSQAAIQQEESLNNLPVMIIKGLADDNLSAEKIQRIQNSWKNMQPKNLLDFLRSYAVSATFHSSDRIKYYTSFDRNLIIYNRLDINNSELHRVISSENNEYWSLPENINWQAFNEENIQPFQPIHNVFGHQQGFEAVNTPSIFRSVYNRSTELWNFNFTVIRDTDNWDNIIWAKDMTTLFTTDKDNHYSVKHITEILWQRLIADGLKNLGVLERAHLYSILADNGLDLGMRFKDQGLISDENYSFSKQELESNGVFLEEINKLGEKILEIDAVDLKQRARANEKLNMALSFISVTPYLFIQEGK